MTTARSLEVVLPDWVTAFTPQNFPIRGFALAGQLVSIGVAGNYVDMGGTSIDDLLSHDEIAQLRTRVTAVERQNTRLRARITALERKVALLSAPEEVIVLRTVSREEAKEEIKALFKSGERLYMSEVADRLQLLDHLVVEACQELLREGAIEINDDSLRTQ